ncbi:MAG TPA: hypothetical protein VFF16_16330 [Telluria sp.]|nr:hypothetical protein [Telluria sp.]
MDAELPPFVFALLAQAAIGGTDVVLNHELIVQLPRQPSAYVEQHLHVLREALYAAIFLCLAWFEWHGGYGGVIVMLFAIELWVSTIDNSVEWDTRVLPRTERMLHVALFVNTGIMLALTGLALNSWMRLQPALAPVDYGWASWLLSLLALVSAGWAVRDARSVLRQKKRGPLGPAS